MPRSMRPVTTVPRPSIEKMSSIGMRNGLSSSRTGMRDVRVERVDELHDLLRPLVVGALALESLEARAADDRGVLAVEALLGEEFADFLFDEVDEVFVVHHVHLLRKTTIFGTPTCLARRMCSRVCGIDAVGRGDHEDGAVHLGGTGDHVLDVVGVARSVDVRVVAVRRLVLGVGERDGDTARLLFRRLVDLVDALRRVAL